MKLIADNHTPMEGLCLNEEHTIYLHIDSNASFERKLMLLLHELAHYTQGQYPGGKSPHSVEWLSEYEHLLDVFGISNEIRETDGELVYLTTNIKQEAK